MLERLTTLARHRICGRCVIPRASVQLRLGVGEDGRRIANYTGLMQCGAIWTCPVCSPRIRQERALEADRACRIWLEAHGPGSLLLLTLTLPHDAGERLVNVLASTRRAFAQLVSGRRWQADKQTYGLRYYIRAHDVTVGPNGWHPHLHLLLFLDQALSHEALDALRHQLFLRWSTAVVGLDRRAPTWEHGVVLEAARSREDASRYVCQVISGDTDDAVPVAYELARSDLKISHHPGHRTPWQVLHDYGEYCLERDRDLWREYEQAMRRVNAIRWANGLRAAVGMTDPELTDEQLVMQEVADDVLYTFTAIEWRQVRDAPGFYEACATAELLDAAEVNGLAGVQWYLTLLRHRQALDNPRAPWYPPSYGIAY